MKSGLPIGMGVGIALGVALGLALDNLALGLGLGVAFGGGFGAMAHAATAANDKKAKSGDEPGSPSPPILSCPTATTTTCAASPAGWITSHRWAWTGSGCRPSSPRP